MASLIEQAALRLEQLRRSGVDVPSVPNPATPSVASFSPPVAAKTAHDGPDVHSPRTPAPTSKSVTLDLETLNAAGIVTPSAPRSYLADQFRLIKRPLLANMKSKGAGQAMLKHSNLIMVTSALAGEGKSFTSVNLAMSIAMELDNTVMLVDADVARPSVLRMLGL
ncbi:P-loop NTPase, partial [Enterococcus faecalis]|uniref:P-loop NTPase n=1 Tax=Enterococcus faecalis TaxID=1351 RepID=UPI0034E54479